MRPRAIIRSSPEDFVVEEIPAYSACGEGEHLFVTIRKRGVTTIDALKELCRALDVDQRGASYAGMKDRHAVTTQALSLPFPLARSVDEVRELSIANVEILEAVRHRNKLKPGHLVGNRFTLVLRQIPPESMETVISALEAAGRDGVPNAFGPQRFGRDGDNAERALAWLTGKARGPRDRREQRLVFSALQAHLFNEVLARRVELGTFAIPLAGDLVKKSDTGGMFICTDPDTDRERARRGELSPTGPLFGAKMRWPEGEPATIEREVLMREAGAANAFDQHRHLGEGTRRALRLMPEGLQVERLADDDQGLRVRFMLPKGGYATTVLAQAVILEDRTTVARHASQTNETALADDSDPPSSDQD